MIWKIYTLYAGTYLLWSAQFVTVHTNDSSRTSHEDRIQVPLNRHKRGLASIIARGALYAARGTSLSVNVVQALTEGCLLHKSICADMEIIDDLDKEIKRIESQYDQQLMEANEDWVRLSNAVTNDGYLSYYIDEMIQKIQNLSDLQEKNIAELESELPKVFALWTASQNLSAEQYLDALLTPLDYSLTDLHKMLEESRDSQLIGLVANILVEATINKFMSSYSKAYKQIGSDGLRDTFLGKLFSSEDTLQQDVLKKEGTRGKLKKSLKMVPKVFKQMKQNTKKYFQKSKTGFHKWKQIKNWKGFKGKLMNLMRLPRAKLNSAKQFVTSSKMRRRQLKSWSKSSKFSKSVAIKEGFGLLVDGITTAIDVVQWNHVADMTTKTRNDYKEYLSELRKHMQDIKKEKDAIAEEWDKVVNSFKDLSKAFDGFIQNASLHADFANVTGLPGIPVSIQNLILNNFDNLNETSLPAAQDTVISFLKENDNNLTEIVDEMLARRILYTGVRNKTSNSLKVEEIFSNLKDIYNFNPSVTVRRYGHRFSKKNLLCTIAIMLVDQEAYDNFKLQPFRPSCDISNATFISIEMEAMNKRNTGILNSVVKRFVEKDNDLTVMHLLHYVQSVYSVMKDQALRDYGRQLTEKDIVCSVATQFPKVDTFDFIHLSIFRPDCSSVSDTNFAGLNRGKENVKSLNVPMVLKTEKSLLRSLNAESNSALSASSNLKLCLVILLCPLWLLFH